MRQREGTADPEGRRGVLLAAATLSQFGGSVTQQGTVVLGVFFAAAYHLSLAQMGAVVSSLTLGLVVSGLVVGSLVDRFGPRRVLGAGTMLLVGIATAIGATRELPMTVALLFALGLVLGAVPVSGTTAILAAWPRERRGLPMGVRQMAVPAGAMAAALALPALAARFGLHPLYFGFAALLAIGGLTFCFVLPARPARIAPGAALLEGLEEMEGARPRISGSEVAPERQARSVGDNQTAAARHKPLRREVTRIVMPALTGFLMVWGQYALVTYTIPFLHDRHGIALAAAGLLLALSQAGAAAARVVLGHVSDRLGGRRDLVLAAAAASGAALAGIVAVLPRDVGMLALAPLWLLLGATMVGWNALMLTWAGERVSLGNAGAAIGLTTSAILLGATISAPAFGMIVEVSGSYRVAWLALGAILAVVAALLWANMRWDGRTAPDTLAERAAIAGR